MKRMNRVTPFLLAFLLTLTVCGNTAAAAGNTPEAQGHFSDIPAGATYASAVAWCVEQGLMNGVETDRFDPDGALERSMLAITTSTAGTKSPTFTNPSPQKRAVRSTIPTRIGSSFSIRTLRSPPSTHPWAILPSLRTW